MTRKLTAKLKGKLTEELTQTWKDSREKNWKESRQEGWHKMNTRSEMKQERKVERKVDRKTDKNWQESSHDLWHQEQGCQRQEYARLWPEQIWTNAQWRAGAAKVEVNNTVSCLWHHRGTADFWFSPTLALICGAGAELQRRTTWVDILDPSKHESTRHAIHAKTVVYRSILVEIQSFGSTVWCLRYPQKDDLWWNSSWGKG